MQIKDLKKGDYFTIKEIAEPKESQVYVRGEYSREVKKYICYKWNDINADRLYAGTKEVYTNFTF